MAGFSFRIILMNAFYLLDGCATIAPYLKPHSLPNQLMLKPVYLIYTLVLLF
jgi:hypothetical protein